MSLSDTYFLASRARSKLTREATRGDHDLRVLVSHANLLDSLMDSLAEQRAKARQQSATESRSVQFVLPPKPEHPTFATIEEVDADDESDSDSDSDSDVSDSVVRVADLEDDDGERESDYDEEDSEDEEEYMHSHYGIVSSGPRSYRDIGTLGDDEEDELPNLTYSSDEDNAESDDESEEPQGDEVATAGDDDLFSSKGQLAVLPLAVRV